MRVLNFGHPLTPAHLAQLSAVLAPISGDLPEPLTEQDVLSIQVQLDPQMPFADQVSQLVDEVELSPEGWQTTPLVVNLPGLAAAVALVLAELHGRMGYFPAVLRLRAVAGSVPVQYEVAEILNLQSVRDAARRWR